MQPAKLAAIVFTPWRKYNEFFDKGCWGIWGLSPILKYTLLYFSLIFPYAFVADNISANIKENIEIIYILILVAIAFIWLIYLPILSIIALFRAFKKVKHTAKELNSTLSEKPWEMTPKRLYIQTHWAFVVYLIYIKDYLIDILDWSTQYYPISLLSTSPIRYPISMKVRHNARAFESQIAFMKIPLKYVDFEINQQNTIYKFELYEKVKDFKKVVKKLEKSFQKDTGFYIREENGQIHIIVPHAEKE